MTKPTNQEEVASKAGLFEELPQPSDAQQVQHSQAVVARKRSEGAVRLLQPNRLQMELRASDLESLLPEDHRARLVWGYVVRQDLSKLVEAVKARGSKRQAHAAKLRAAQAREKRIQAALDQLPEVAETKKRNGNKAEDARASTTDAQARVMKMGDGGFRPAFNVQFATTCQAQVIVGMDVVNAGSDMAQFAPMVEPVQKRLGQSPDQWLVDGGFPAHDQIDAVAHKTEVYAPVPEPKTKKDKQGNAVQQDTVPDKHQPKPGDSEAVASWRVRTGLSGKILRASMRPKRFGMMLIAAVSEDIENAGLLNGLFMGMCPKVGVMNQDRRGV
jgi:hypothetical protein